MKIAYLIHWNEGPESGVFKKVIQQMTQWHQLGNEVALFLFTHKGDIEWAGELPDIRCFVQPYTGWGDRFPQFKKLAKQLDDWQPTVIYHRFDLFYFSLPKLLRKYASILEINTNDLTEMRMDRDLRYYYHRLTRGLVLRATDGFVFVSGELAEEGHTKRYVRDHVVIGNGIRLDDFQPSLPPANTAPRFVFIGSAGQSWHGIDHISILAKARPQWHFDIIGAERTELEEAVPANMHFHGKMSRPQYQHLMDQADIAIGTLALYRKQMSEASPLKVREYLANGLPVIIAYEETDFNEDVPHILVLRNGPDNIHNGLTAIDAFVETWQGKRVDRESVSRLDTLVKEAQRLSYMKQITDKKGTLRER
ncbi:glycosyltransferase family 4 protein [Paenibacillus sp. YIM B09110]|uniref:glycosyltransferase family 4 protein n=1 Tax=Paenibacillus sp. YIM B09110 TaxID=3126102 RepID=UPI00301D22C8